MTNKELMVNITARRLPSMQLPPTTLDTKGQEFCKFLFDMRKLMFWWRLTWSMNFYWEEITYIMVGYDAIDILVFLAIYLHRKKTYIWTSISISGESWTIVLYSISVNDVHSKHATIICNLPTAHPQIRCDTVATFAGTGKLTTRTQEDENMICSFKSWQYVCIARGNKSWFQFIISWKTRKQKWSLNIVKTVSEGRLQGNDIFLSAEELAPDDGKSSYPLQNNTSPDCDLTSNRRPISWYWLLLTADLSYTS